MDGEQKFWAIVWTLAAVVASVAAVSMSSCSADGVRVRMQAGCHCGSAFRDGLPKTR